MLSLEMMVFQNKRWSAVSNSQQHSAAYSKLKALIPFNHLQLVW